MDETTLIEALERADSYYVRALRAVDHAESRDRRSLHAEDRLRGHRDNAHTELTRIRDMFRH
jgi:hypothetical protein